MAGPVRWGSATAVALAILGAAACGPTAPGPDDLGSQEAPDREADGEEPPEDPEAAGEEPPSTEQPPEDPPSTDTDDSLAPRPAAPDVPPSTWLAGRRDGDQLVVEVHDDEEVTTHEYGAGEGIVDGESAYELGFEDVAIDEDTIVVVTCCEPVAGSVAAYRSAPSPDPVAVAQAVRIDLHDGVLARTDGSGFAALRPAWLAGDADAETLELDMAYDIALVPAAEGPVIALVDAGQPRDARMYPLGEPVLASVRLDGTTLRTIPLDAEAICGVVPMEGTAVGVLTGELHEGCLADRLLRIDVDNGEVAGEVTLGEGVARANTDASGRYLIALTDAGGVIWHDLRTDEGGELAPPGDYEAADW